jgi:hypothetical protein
LLSAATEPFVLPPVGGVIEASPDASFVLYDSERQGELENLAEADIVTIRMDVPSGKKTELPGCFAPKLSPSGKWIVCRDVHANVRRMRFDGSELAIVALSGVSHDQIEWVPYAYVYPEPVAFPGPTTLEYSVQLKDGTVTTRTTSFAE